MPKDCYQDGVGVGVGAGAVSKVCPNADGTRTANQCSEEHVRNVGFPAFESVSKVETRLKMLTDV